MSATTEADIEREILSLFRERTTLQRELRATSEQLEAVNARLSERVEAQQSRELFSAQTNPQHTQ